MKHTCDYYMEQYLMLDKHQIIPVSISKHFVQCKQCRTEIKMLNKAEQLISQPVTIKTPLKEDSVSSQLKKIYPEFDSKKYHVSISHWIIFGIVLLAAFATFGYLIPLKDNLLVQFEYFSAFAGSIIAYFASFFYANIDYFVKKTSISNSPLLKELKE